MKDTIITISKINCYISMIEKLETNNIKRKWELERSDKFMVALSNTIKIFLDVDIVNKLELHSYFNKEISRSYNNLRIISSNALKDIKIIKIKRILNRVKKKLEKKNTLEVKRALKNVK